jgi:hypothetical protein
VAKVPTGIAARDVSISSSNISSVGGFIRHVTYFRYTPQVKSRGLNYVTLQGVIEVDCDVSVIVWWCAILLKVKWLIPAELMNGR